MSMKYPPTQPPTHKCVTHTLTHSFIFYSAHPVLSRGGPEAFPNG